MAAEKDETLLIQDVSDTAFWVAHLRAVESKRADALFRDPLAGKLAGERGRAIAAHMPMTPMTGWMISLRTKIIDEYLRAAVAEGVDTVLNLGAGLDTRPYRMDLPASLRWIEVDYPKVIDFKESTLAAEKPRFQLERVRLDLADLKARQALFRDVNARASRVFVLTEGVVPYLALEEAASLAEDIRAISKASHWVVEYFSKETMAYRRKRAGFDKKMKNAQFKFNPEDWLGFFARHGWKPRETRYMAEESRKAGRKIPLPLMAKIFFRIHALLTLGRRGGQFRKFAAYMVLERT
jgi:methyltransferase (TIGR00027 family)